MLVTYRMVIRILSILEQILKYYEASYYCIHKKKLKKVGRDPPPPPYSAPHNTTITNKSGMIVFKSAV